MLNFRIENPKCVFIHIPKTGGTSIKKGFFQGKHTKVEGEIPFLWRGHYKFAFIRNPYSRFKSCYKMFRWGMDYTGWKAFSGERPELDIKEFINIANDESIDFWSRKTIESKLRHHVLPQTHTANCLKYADFIGKFETLNQDFRIICYKLGIEGTLPVMNKSRSTEEKTDEIFTDQAVEFIQTYYKNDFDQLGYDIDDIPK